MEHWQQKIYLNAAFFEDCDNRIMPEHAFTVRRSSDSTIARVALRNWIDSDISPFVAMCRDPEVMQHFPGLESEENATAYVRAYQQHFADFGFTYFAAEELSSGEFIGFVGLKHQTYESPFTPCVDIGWRLKRSAWGKGYATEAAKACLKFAFGSAGLEEVFAMCTNTNAGSESVMKKIGMRKVGTFLHPAIASDSPLNPCLAYRIQMRSSAQTLSKSN